MSLIQMSLVQVRDVPDASVKALRISAAERGLTLTGYLRQELDQLAARPSNAEIASALRGHVLGGLLGEDRLVEVAR